MRRTAITTTSASEQLGGREHWNTFSAQKGACQCRIAISDSMRNTFSAQKSDGSSGGYSVRQLRHVTSPAAVSTATPSLLRKVRASAASRFPIQCETLSLLRKVMAVREAAV